MSKLEIQRRGLETKLDMMGVELSDLTRDLLNLTKYSPNDRVGQLESNSGQAKGLIVGHVRAYRIIDDILSAGYVAISTPTYSELDQSVYASEQEYGTENVYVFSIAELSGIDDEDLDNRFSYIFVRDELADGRSIPYRETMFRMWILPN